MYSILEQTVFLDDSRLEPFEPVSVKQCAQTNFKNWMQKQFLGFANHLDNDTTEMIPDRFKIDAFLVLIDVSKEKSSLLVNVYTVEVRLRVQFHSES